MTKEDTMGCFECGAERNLTDYHVVPPEMGGTKTVELCPECLGKVRALREWLHGSKIRAGIERARAEGRQIGAARGIPAEVIRTIRRLRAEGLSNYRIADHLNEQGISGPRGGRWYESGIRAALRRYADVT